EQRVQAFIQAHGWGTGGGDASSAVSSMLGAVQRGLASLAGRALGKLGGLASLVLLPLFTYYILAHHDRARSSALSMVPARRLPQATRFLEALERALRAYVRGQALVCLTMGAAVTVVLWILGLPVALLLGVLAGLGEIIPILGAWIAAAAIAL